MYVLIAMTSSLLAAKLAQVGSSVGIAIKNSELAKLSLAVVEYVKVLPEEVEMQS